MTSHDDDRLDFNKLQKELDAAVVQDERYWRENDVKIRAVSTQRVATYEEFKASFAAESTMSFPWIPIWLGIHIKDLVAASHLKPLNKGDHIDNINETAKHPWNPAACRDKQNSSAPKTTQVTESGIKVPKSGQEFARDWQRQVKTPEQRYTYLLSCGAPHLAELFKTEVSFGLLGDILTALTIFEEKDVKTVVEILSILQASNRFSLSLQFLSKKEKEMCQQLFDRLIKVVEDENVNEVKETVFTLQTKYLTS